MQHVLKARVLRRFRFKAPQYSWIRGHTGVDLDFHNEILESPITGVVRAVTKQTEMGRCIYIVDIWGSCHVFAHMGQIDVHVGQSVKRGERIGITGNTGNVTTGPHLHWEVITPRPYHTSDIIMRRKELDAYAGKGYNTDPIIYLWDLYHKYNVQP